MSAVEPADPFDAVAAVADAVLFEGYLLYPYRASAQKNALRWQFGVLVPPACAEALAEPSASRTECLVEPRPGAVLRVRLRFLQMRPRAVLDADGVPGCELVVDGTRHLAWDEAVPRTVDAVLDVAALGGEGVTVPVVLDAAEEREEIHDGGGARAGHYVRTTAAVRGSVRVSTTPVPGPYGALRLRVDVVNETTTAARPPERAEALRSALISAHVLLGIDAGAFLSTADPPEWAAPAVAACVQEHSWPVLAGPAGTASLVLASPIILEDHPQLAPESPTDLFDGTENDEILSLRTLALTDDEKAEARATDPRAAGLLDALEAMGPAMFERLHGTIRPGGRAPDDIPTIVTPGAAGPPPEASTTPWWDPGEDAAVDPETDSTLVEGRPVSRGSAVVLMPGGGTDAQDMFLRGMGATVQAVVHDVDGGVHVAVSLDDDPGADLQTTHGRFRYFRPDELAVP